MQLCGKAGVLGCLLFSAAVSEDEGNKHTGNSESDYLLRVVGLTSAFYVGSGADPGFECTVGVHKEPLEIGHTFGGGGGGEVWQHSGLVVTLDAASRKRALAEQVALHLRVEAASVPFKLQSSTLYVGGLREAVEIPMHWEVHGRPACPPYHCLIPQPQVSPASEPHCGWAPPLSALSLVGTPEDGEAATLEVDILPLLAQNFTALKIWTSPTSVSEVGMWQTPRFLLRSLSLARVTRETMV